MRKVRFAVATTDPTGSASSLASTEPPSLIRPKRMASQRPQAPAKKRCKLDPRISGLLSEHSCSHRDESELNKNPPSQATRGFNICSDKKPLTTNTNDIIVPRSELCSYGRSKVERPVLTRDDLYSDVGATVRKNMQRIIETQEHVTGNSCLAWRPNSKSISLSFSTTNEASAKSHLDLRVIDIATETAELYIDDVEKIRLAADYLRGAHCYVESFQLYFLLFQWSQGQIKTVQSSRIQKISILGCARTAVTKSHIEIVQNLLERNLSQSAYAVDTAESFLFESFLSDFAWRLGDRETATKHRNIACRSRFVENKSFDYLSQEDRSLDLITYQVLLKVIADASVPGIPTSFYHLKDGIILLRPGPFEYSGGCLAKTSLRACLNWFASVLGSSKIFRASWKNLTSLQHRNNVRTSYITLYSGMWGSYRRQEEPVFLQKWVVDVETQLGIPPTEMISCVCGMILKAGPPSLCRLDDGFPSSFRDAAQTGVQRLIDLPDLKLAERFLVGFVNHKEFFRQARSDEQRAYNRLAQDYVRAFVQERLHIVLPPIITNSEKSITLTPFMTPQSDETVFESGFFTALAPSLSSRGLDSMADLRDRIDGSLETAMSEMSLEVPSAAMGNVSWKSNESQLSGTIELYCGLRLRTIQ
ncbi:hypothetical protein F4679DRAFT_109928 [Xylaria curta]|nr:hypothetical protein F4679DRAFT_109928 [Xylaria curta]